MSTKKHVLVPYDRHTRMPLPDLSASAYFLAVNDERMKTIRTNGTSLLPLGVPWPTCAVTGVPIIRTSSRLSRLGNTACSTRGESAREGKIRTRGEAAALDNRRFSEQGPRNVEALNRARRRTHRPLWHGSAGSKSRSRKRRRATQRTSPLTHPIIPSHGSVRREKTDAFAQGTPSGRTHLDSVHEDLSSLLLEFSVLLALGIDPFPDRPRLTPGPERGRDPSAGSIAICGRGIGVMMMFLIFWPETTLQSL